MMRLFLDANILFTAAHNPSGKSALIIKLSADGHWRTLTCRLAVEEARRNIERKYPHCLPALDALISTIEVTPLPPPPGTLFTRQPTSTVAGDS
jgi:predicted nucleic acid-binding protein